MKTPEEIKKGLECCPGQYFGVSCGNCLYSNDVVYCGENGVRIMKDALKYIEQLEADLTAVKQERDAAVSDMKRAQGCICNICKSHYRPDPAVRRYECKILGKFSEIFGNDDGGALFCGKFEWRGVCPENTEVQGDG